MNTESPSSTAPNATINSSNLPEQPPADTIKDSAATTPSPNPIPAPDQIPPHLKEVFEDIATISCSWASIGKVTPKDITAWMEDEFLIQGPRQIVAGVNTFSTILGAFELAANGGDYEPVVADYFKYNLKLLDFALARISAAIVTLVNSRANYTRNQELMFEAVDRAMGDGPRAAELTRKCHQLFPKNHIDANGEMYGGIPARFAYDTFDRIQALDGLAGEFPREVREAAINMPAWPYLESVKPNPKDRQDFEKTAARLDLGAACPPENFAPEEESPQSHPQAEAPENSIPFPPSGETEGNSEDRQAGGQSFAPPPSGLSRKGKIGRLPAKIRHELNLRLSDGVETAPLLAWLNAQPEVEDILRRDFAARPVTPQNLSEWRQGGFQDWLRNQQTLEIAGDLVQQSASLDALMGSVPFSQRLATIMSAQFMQVATPLLDEAGADVEKRWHRTQQLLKELSRLRRNDIQYAKLKFETSRPRARSGSYTDLTRMEKLRKAAEAA